MIAVVLLIAFGIVIVVCFTLSLVLPHVIRARAEIKVTRLRHLSRATEREFDRKISVLAKGHKDLDERIAELERYTDADDIIQSATGKHGA